MKKRQNQKSRRKAHKDAGIFSKGSGLRVVEMHPTKGFREKKGDQWRETFAAHDQADKPISLQRGKIVNVMAPVRPNKIG